MAIDGDRHEMGREPVRAAPLAVVVATSVVAVFVLTAPSEFVLDDIINLRMAQVQGLSVDYLLQATSGHFSPGHLFSDWFVQSAFGFEFAAAQVIQGLGLAVSLVLFYAVVVLLTRGRQTVALVATLVWGVSVAHVQTMQWWAAGIDRVPANVATLGAILAYLWFWRTGRQAWLVTSVAIMAAGMLFYVKPAFVPGYLILIRLLLLEPERPVRETAAAALREWRVWAPYLVVAVVLGAAYTAYYPDYDSDRSLGALSEYGLTMWFRVVAPNLVGLYVPQGALRAAGWMTIVAAQAAVGGFVAWTVFRRAGGWRPWAFLATAAAPNVASVALNRLDFYPPERIAYTNAFNQEVFLLFFLAAAVAVSWRTPPGWSPRPAARGVLAAALALYVAASWTIGWHLNRPEIWVGTRAGNYFDRVEASLDELDAADGVLVDGVVRPEVLIPLATPYNNLSEVVPLLRDGVAFDLGDSDRGDGDGSNLFALSSQGRLRPVTFLPVAGGSVAALLESQTLGITDATIEGEGGTPCVVAGDEPAAVVLPLREPLRGRSAYVRTTYRARSPSRISFLADPLPMAEAPLFDYVTQRVVRLRDTERHTRVLSLETRTVDSLGLSVFPGSDVCLESLEIGLLEPR